MNSVLVRGRNMVLALLVMGGLAAPAMAGERHRGDDRRPRERECERRDRGCERPVIRRGHARGRNFISMRPGRSYIIIRASSGCEGERRRERCH